MNMNEYDVGVMYVYVINVVGLGIQKTRVYQNKLSSHIEVFYFITSIHNSRGSLADPLYRLPF